MVKRNKPTKRRVRRSPRQRAGKRRLTGGVHPHLQMAIQDAQAILNCHTAIPLSSTSMFPTLGNIQRYRGTLTSTSTGALAAYFYPSVLAAPMYLSPTYTTNDFPTTALGTTTAYASPVGGYASDYRVIAYKIKIFPMMTEATNSGYVVVKNFFSTDEGASKVFPTALASSVPVEKVFSAKSGFTVLGMPISESHKEFRHTTTTTTTDIDDWAGIAITATGLPASTACFVIEVSCSIEYHPTMTYAGYTGTGQSSAAHSQLTAEIIDTVHSNHHNTDTTIVSGDPSAHVANKVNHAIQQAASTPGSAVKDALEGGLAVVGGTAVGKQVLSAASRGAKSIMGRAGSWLSGEMGSIFGAGRRALPALEEAGEMLMLTL